MAAWLLWFLPLFEAGFWSALVAGKLRGRGRTRELLVYGRPARISTSYPRPSLRTVRASPNTMPMGTAACRRSSAANRRLSAKRCPTKTGQHLPKLTHAAP
jgi:hypothetical protein